MKRTPHRLLPALCAAGILAWSGIAGCGQRPAPRAATAVELSPREREAIAAARRAVAQHENWVERAEFTIARRGDQWHVTAWRVENAQAQGNQRYLPWGRRRILVDDAGKVLEYTNER